MNDLEIEKSIIYENVNHFHISQAYVEVELFCAKWCTIGIAEFAGLEFAGLENDGLENDGRSRRGGMT